MANLHWPTKFQLFPVASCCSLNFVSALLFLKLPQTLRCVINLTLAPGLFFSPPPSIFPIVLFSLYLKTLDFGFQNFPEHCWMLTHVLKSVWIDGWQAPQSGVAATFQPEAPLVAKTLEKDSIWKFTWRQSTRLRLQWLFFGHNSFSNLVCPNLLHHLSLFEKHHQVLMNPMGKRCKYQQFDDFSTESSSVAKV